MFQNNVGKNIKEWWTYKQYIQKMSILHNINFSFSFQQVKILGLSKKLSLYFEDKSQPNTMFWGGGGEGGEWK